MTGQSINGTRGNSNNLTVDGGSNLDSGSTAARSTTSASASSIKSRSRRRTSPPSSAATAALPSTSSRGAAPIAFRAPRATTFAMRSSTAKLLRRARRQRQSHEARTSSSATSRVLSAARSCATSCSFSAASNTASSIGSRTRRGRRCRRALSSAVISLFACAAPTTSLARQTTGCCAIRRRTAVSWQCDPGRPHHGRWQGDGEYFRKDDRSGVRVHQHADSQQRDVSDLQPIRAAAGHHPHRLAGDGEPADSRPLPARRVRPARSCTVSSQGRRCRPCRRTGRGPARAIRSATPGSCARTLSTRRG